MDVLLRLGRVEEARHTAAAYVEAADARGQPQAPSAGPPKRDSGLRRLRRACLEALTLPECRRAVGGVASLAPQELQVALLLADGRTTREAAAALFLSPKTVDHHLRKACTKLGIRSRDELTAAVAPA